MGRQHEIETTNPEKHLFANVMSHTYKTHAKEESAGVREKARVTGNSSGKRLMKKVQKRKSHE